jgi:glycosyltransferase involved in cell wall biosynthesis
MNHPRVSIVMAIHEDTPFLEEAVRSVLAQAYRDFEFVVVANGASDALWQRLRGFADPRIRLVRTRMRGFAFALNVGISESRGEYLARMDADDVVESAKLGRQVDFLDRHPRVGLVGSWVTLIDEQGRPLDRKAARFTTDAEIRRVLPYRNPLIHATLLFRRKLLLEAQGYLHGHMSEDHELFIRIARRREVEFANIPEELYRYRKHAGQATSLERSKEAYWGIASFLFAEFLRTKNPKYLLGIGVVHPWRRLLASGARSLRGRGVR